MMPKERLRAIVGSVAIAGALLLVVIGAVLLAGGKLGDAEFAAWALLAREFIGLAVSVVRSLFPGPEIDLPPKEPTP